MGKHSTTIFIDGVSLHRDAVESYGGTIDLSRKMGCCDSFITTVCKRGTMSESAYKLLCFTLNIPYETYLADEPIKWVNDKPKVEDGYYCSITTEGNLLTYEIFYCGELIVRTQAFVKTTDDYGFSQAVSYASFRAMKQMQSI